MTPRRADRSRQLGLRARIALAVAVVCGLGTLAMAVTVYRFQADSAKTRFETSARVSLASDIEQIRGFLWAEVPNWPTGVETTTTEVIVDVLWQRKGMHWSLYDFRGDDRPRQADGFYSDPTASSHSWPIPAGLVDAVRPTRDGYTGQELDRPPMYVVAGRIDYGIVLVEAYSLRQLEDDLSALRHTLALVTVVVTTLSTAAALAAAHFAQRPVRAAATAARRFGDGEFDVRLPVRGRDALATLASEFNDMAQRLKDVIAELHTKDRQQQRFIADAAHDLRTPIATMIASLDGLHDPAARETAAALLNTQTRRLTRLVEDLLEISRFDAGTAQVRLDRVELGALVADAVALVVPGGIVETRPGDRDNAADEAAVHGEPSHATVWTRCDGDDAIEADPRRLHTVISNLVANALAHGTPPVDVHIDGTRRDTVAVRVSDHGPGIRRDLLPLVFDRFVRGDSARGDGGTGLGLAIAWENVAAHGGHIEVTNAGGAVFTVSLPRTPCAGNDTV